MKSINTKIQEEKGGKIKQTSPSNMRETALWLNKNKDRNAKGKPDWKDPVLNIQTAVRKKTP